MNAVNEGILSEVRSLAELVHTKVGVNGRYPFLTPHPDRFPDCPAEVCKAYRAFVAASYAPVRKAAR